ncbi:MAG TPA: hypothetical protein VGD81_16715 [Opitutaceae bacterium]
MPVPDLPPLDPRAADLARKKRLTNIAAGLLALSGLVILALPLDLPLPVRLGVAFTDLVGAAAVWLIGRQRYSQ